MNGHIVIRVGVVVVGDGDTIRAKSQKQTENNH